MRHKTFHSQNGAFLSQIFDLKTILSFDSKSCCFLRILQLIFDEGSIVFNKDNLIKRTVYSIFLVCKGFQKKNAVKGSLSGLPTNNFHRLVAGFLFFRACFIKINFLTLLTITEKILDIRVQIAVLPYCSRITTLLNIYYDQKK